MLAGCSEVRAQSAAPADQGGTLYANDIARLSSGVWALPTNKNKIDLNELSMRSGIASQSITAPRQLPRLASPVIRNVDEAALLLRGTRVSMVSPQQVVPELPNVPLFQDAKFQGIRSALDATCREKANSVLAAEAALLNLPPGSPLTSLAQYKAAAAAYGLSCFAPLNTVPKPIMAVVGILAVSGGGGALMPFCSATAVGSNQIVSARHCFFSEFDGKAKPAELEALESGQVTFRSLNPSQQDVNFTVTPGAEADLSPQVFQPYQDEIVLRTDLPLQAFAVRASDRIAQSDVPVPLWLVGANVMPSLSNQWIGNVRDLTWASGPKACAVVGVSETGCAYHTCQTSPSSSGAGLLREKNGAVYLVAVHHGPASRAGACEAQAPADLRLNLAALLPL